MSKPYLSTYLARLHENLSARNGFWNQPEDSDGPTWHDLQLEALAAERGNDVDKLRALAEYLGLDPDFYEFQIKL